MKELTINERIRDREVRLIGEDGTQYGVISTNEARQIAEEHGLDLCKVTPDGVTPATCKLMDYGKYRYEQQKREKVRSKWLTILGQIVNICEQRKGQPFTVSKATRST